MRKDELRDAGNLTGAALGEVVSLTRSIHQAVAQRVFDGLGKPAQSVRVIHDMIAGAVHGSVELGVRTLPGAAAAGAAALRRTEAESLHENPVGHALLNALSGWMGDRLVGSYPSLAPKLKVRTAGGALRARPENVAYDAGRAATGRIAVLLHGLGETDRQWGTWAGGRSYASLLTAVGWTPLYVSYNSGLPVRMSGVSLSAYLEELTAAWPVPVESIALIGHSMGGLVAYVASQQQAKWTTALTRLIALGTPFRGVPLERLAHLGSGLLNRLPETRQLSSWLDTRSAGVKDLRLGLDSDPLPGVSYYTVSAALTGQLGGMLVSDLLVTQESAQGHVAAENHLHLEGKNHFHLLGDATVGAQLVAWLNDDEQNAANR
jgi:pimeloyl-ACP methyl ester carboxylesterase